MSLYVFAALCWLLLFVLAALNGALRDFILTPWLGGAARPLSAVTLIAMHAVAIAVFVRWAAPTQREAWVIGLGWLAASLSAEALLIARAGKPAANVLSSFSWATISAGEWVAFAFAFVAVAPALFAWLFSR
jgi:hypothetical protein